MTTDPLDMDACVDNLHAFAAAGDARSCRDVGLALAMEVARLRARPAAPDRNAEVQEWLACRGLPPTAGLKELIEHERGTAALVAVFAEMKRGQELVAAVLHYHVGTIAPVAFLPGSCGTCARAVELYEQVMSTYPALAGPPAVTDALCIDPDNGATFAEHDWTKWVDRPADMEPGQVQRLRWCVRCNLYESDPSLRFASSNGLDQLTFRDVSDVNRARCERWHPGFPHDGWTGADWCNAMAGEAGEACNVVKKLRRADFGITQASGETTTDLYAKLATEIGDTLLYLDLLAQFYGLDIAACVASTFNRVSVREGLPERIQTTAAIDRRAAAGQEAGDG